MLAKIHRRPELDPRKPYTEIGDADAFSGRTYDEQYLAAFIKRHRLPCNPTTAFLTPALRNIDRTVRVEIIGRPRRVYRDALLLLDDVFAGRVRAEQVAAEAIRFLMLMRDERDARRAMLLADLQGNKDALPLASEAIVKLITQHLECKHSSRSTRADYRGGLPCGVWKARRAGVAAEGPQRRRSADGCARGRGSQFGQRGSHSDGLRNEDEARHP